MDGFVASLKPQVIRLDAYDDISSTSSIPLYFWYETPVAPNVLKDSFYKTLEEFPILAGRIKTGNDSRNFVAIEKDHLNIPAYTDSSCDVHFQTLKDADFDINLLPADYSSACKTPVAPGIFGRCMKLAEIHVLRMKDNSGMCIFASVAHMILDGKGYYSFMSRWAEISNHTVSAPEQQDMLVREYQHDRSILETDKHGGCDVLEPEVCQMFNQSTSIARWIAWVSPELRGRIFKYMISSTRTRNHYRRLSSSAYEQLVKLIQPFVESGVSHLSANDVITALAAVLFAQAFYRTGRLDGETVFVANVMIDVRPRVKNLASYVGNALLVNGAVNPLDLFLKDCSPQVLAAVACSIRRMVDGIDERYCNQMGHMLNKYPCSYVDMVLQITKMSNSFASTNHTRFKYYEMDFGCGPPTLVRPAFLVFENDFVIMPAHPDIGGYELVFTTAPDVEEAMKQSEYWQFIY